MSRVIAMLLLAAACCFTAKAQRILETVRDPANPQFQNVVYNGNILVAGNQDSFLLSYDDVSFTERNYPIVSGARLRFSAYKNPLTPFESSIFFALGPSGSATRYLYRFSGTTFSMITISGNMVTNCIVYGSYLYFLSNVSGTVRLFRYSSGTVSEVTGASIPNAAGYELHVAGSYLYITGYASATGTVNFIRRYNGSIFFTLPWSGSGTNADGVFAVPGTPMVYFTSHERILYYNGSSVSQVFYNTGEAVYPRMWGSTLYFTTGVGGLPGRTSYLYRLSGATLTNITLPGGARVATSGPNNPEVFGGALYIAGVYPDGVTRLLSYNGTSFTPVFDFPSASAANGVRLFVREGKLLLHPNFGNGNIAYEYNGTDFTEIITPAGRLLFPYINSTACNHLWLNYYSNMSGIHWAYAKESKGCPPPPGPVVIPEHFRDYERFDMTNYGPERGWCWSEIIIDWEIVPICPLPPCPEPNYEVRMADANNGIAWSAKFNKPSAFTVPLPDQQPYKTVLSSTDAQKDLLIFEPDLLPMGIEIIKVNFKPKQNYFLLTATTRKNAAVPLKVTLLNATGKILWEQTFTAPFSQQITATVQEPGQALIFSIPQQGSKLITQARNPCPDEGMR